MEKKAKQVSNVGDIQNFFKELDESQTVDIQLDVVMDVNSAFWKAAPEGIKQSIIYNYFLLLRSQEELKHLEQDMLNTSNFFLKKENWLK